MRILATFFIVLAIVLGVTSLAGCESSPTTNPVPSIDRAAIDNAGAAENLKAIIYHAEQIK